MSDISTGLIEFAEHKRLLFSRIRHKLGSYKVDGQDYQNGVVVDLTDDCLSDLYVESAEVIDLHISLKSLNITDDKIKMKWMGLYTTALAKETHARITWAMRLSANPTQDTMTEYNNLLAESKEEKDNLIAMLDGSDTK